MKKYIFILAAALTAGANLLHAQSTEHKGATVKNYGMAIFNEVGGKVEGLWTGGVKTKVKMSYITIPLLANYKINNRWKVVAGPYFSYMMDGDFSGEVYEGHLRTPDATGSRID